MKKVAFVFVVAVFVPSLVLAWLAVRSLRDQQFVLERQQYLLCQGAADALAREAGNFLTARQHDFAQQVETMLGERKVAELTRSFDERLRTNWPLAEVGFVVTTKGDLLCPTPPCTSVALDFREANAAFLGNRLSAEVYWNAANPTNSAYQLLESKMAAANMLSAGQNLSPQQSPVAVPTNSDNRQVMMKNSGAINLRTVVPQQQALANSKDGDNANFSKVASTEAEFRQLIGDGGEGTVARFLNNKLNLLFWYRPPSDPQLVFGAQISVAQLKEGLKSVVQDLNPTLQQDIVAALLDDAARPVALSNPGYHTTWKHPFVATEIGEAVPHWEMAVYLLDPGKVTKSVCTLNWTFGLLIGVLVLAISAGGWLIVTDLNRQLTLARQKTDFVSNVSHELKTPLTSIRMFSELLAEGRVVEPEKQRSYLNIITAEAARLTRLINNVLDFARLERGEKKYNRQHCDLTSLVRETVETYRPHLESGGFKLEVEGGDAEIAVNGDRDALAQIVVNLLSNAEKYSDGGKEILVQMERQSTPLPHAEVRVLDRGPGVPPGSEEKIFEQFYRAHDSLGSGIQGSGLGLTLARQIARAHGGDVAYQPRAGGGSCFTLRLPLMVDS